MNKKTILAVDDSSSIRKFILLALKVYGYRVITAEDGMKALEMLPNEDIDLLITDLNMPNMDGYELIRIIRQDLQMSELPIIILSSLSDNENMQQGLEYGANSYLVKPFNSKRLQYEIAKYLS